MTTTQDLEMNDVKSPLMENDTEKLPEVEFKGSKHNLEDKKEDTEFHGLTKEELEQFAKDPFWRKLRIILFVLFWVVWLGMLIAAVLIVVMSPACPKRPKLEFWEKKTGYWVDPFAFVDTDNNKIGDFKGIMSKLDYIEKELGAGYIILDPIFKGQYSGVTKIGSVNNFKELDPALGTMDSFLSFVKEARKRGIEIILTADFNALSNENELIQKDGSNVLIQWNNNFDKWKRRSGEVPKTSYQTLDFYSAVNVENMLELNLQHSVVLDMIKESIKFWLDKGVRGFHLTNVGMYVENGNSKFNIPYQNMSNPWYEKKWTNGQLFTNETQSFLKEIRKVMDEVAKKTDKTRLLIVNAGDVGFGLDGNDEMLQYLGSGEKIADMIVGREFLINRGWQLTNRTSPSSVSNYLSTVPADQRKRVALSSATSINMRSDCILKMAAPFLIEGNPILYYGSELGLQCDVSTINSLIVPFYPQDKNFSHLPGEYPRKCNHMIMPWDNSGKGFGDPSNQTDKYIAQANVTVEGLTAIGRGETVFQLHRKLIKIHKEPSFQWGKSSMFLEEKGNTYSFEIFTRRAEGFPTMIVALLRDKAEGGKVFSFNSICEKFTPILVYPSNSNLPENVEVDSKNVFLKVIKGKSIYVFKCS